MNVDWTINIANIITIVTGLLVIVYKMSKMENKVELMWMYFTNNFERRKDSSS